MVNVRRWGVLGVLFSAAVLLLSLSDTHAELLRHRKVITLKSGSIDGLAEAISKAGPGGTVVVRPGLHTESGTVLIDIPVSILGLPGAILESSTTPDPGFIIVEAALHIRGASGVSVSGLELRPPAGVDGNTGIVIEDAARVVISGNRITGHQNGILVQNGDRAQIIGNTIAATSLGITNINGRDVRITGNDVSGLTFGIWACDLGGRAAGNRVHDSFVGLILCKVPEGGAIISGNPVGSISSGAEWTVHNNVATNNGWGYLVIDGANTNTLFNNAATGSAFYDMELTADTFRFGFLTPMSFDNTVHAGLYNIIIKDCGTNNTVNGGTQVDITVDPCF